MSLVIEDGSLVALANSYASVQDVRDYADLRGITSVPVADADVEALLVKACDFLQTLEGRYKGFRTSDSQALSWPRQEVYLFSPDTLFGDDAIPSQLIAAQCQLAIDAITLTLQPNGSGREVIRQKVDVIETEYAKGGSSTIQPEFNKAMGLLGPCLNDNGFGIRTIRV